MGRTSSAVKNRWNAANYDGFRVFLKKGKLDKLRAACKAAGVSMNSVFAQAADRFIAEHPEPDGAQED